MTALIAAGIGAAAFIILHGIGWLITRLQLDDDWNVPWDSQGEGD